MKAFIGVSILVLITFILSVVGYYTIDSYTATIIKDLQKLEIAVRSDSWSEAETIVKKLDKDWKTVSSFFPTLIDHAELHDLEIFIAEKSSLLDFKDKEKLLVQISSAKELVKNIKEQEKFSLTNIL